MSVTWRSADPPEPARPGPGGWLRVGYRGVPLVVVLLGGLGVLLVLRLAERPLFGARRPWTPAIAQVVCRVSVAILGIGYAVRGRPMDAPGALVSNHSSWLDILALNAGGALFFVAKSEVAGWPVIGWLARAAGTVFISRQSRDAGVQRGLFEARLAAGHRLLFFPEGTSTDGMRVLPFKSALFSAFFAEALRERLWLQPVTVIWHAPEGADPRLYGWWGDMALGPHLLQTLATAPQGRVEIVYHAPLRAADFPDRKALARACEARVRAGLPPERGD